MDKIKEEFENDFNIDSIYEYDDKWYTTDNLKKATEVQKVDCTTLNRILCGYRKGYKSRNEEINKLRGQREKLILTLELFIEKIEGIPQFNAMIESVKDQIRKSGYAIKTIHKETT